MTGGRESLLSAHRRDGIRDLVRRWCSEPDPDELLWSPHMHTLPASPDDVFWLLDVIEAMRALLIEADSAISHLHHRNIWPLDHAETDRLIGQLRKASE